MPPAGKVRQHNFLMFLIFLTRFSRLFALFSLSLSLSRLVLRCRVLQVGVAVWRCASKRNKFPYAISLFLLFSYSLNVLSQSLSSLFGRRVVRGAASRASPNTGTKKTGDARFHFRFVFFFGARAPRLFVVGFFAVRRIFLHSLKTQ